MEPRAWVEVDGQALRWGDISETKVVDTLYMAANTFDITLRNDSLLSDYLRKNQEVSIYFGYVNDPTNWFKTELTHIFTGKIDGVKPNFTNPMTCRIFGRDYAAPFLDTTFTVAYAQRTASQIAQILCDKYKLTPVITSTTDIIDRDMYQNRKEWEVIQALADLEGFICYVDKDKNFYFGPRNLSDEEIEMNLVFNQGMKSNSRIEFDDSALDTYNQVTVRHYYKKQLIEGIAKNDTLIQSMGQVKERVFNNSKVKSQSQAQALAEKLLPEVSRYVITGQATKLVGNPNLTTEKKVSVTGCGRFDQNYYVEKSTHTLNKGGYLMDLDLTSLRPDSAAQYRQDLYPQDRNILGSKSRLGSDTL